MDRLPLHRRRSLWLGTVHADQPHTWRRSSHRWVVLMTLMATIPAFYVELLMSAPSPLADAVYGCAALAVLLTEFPLRGLRLPRSVLAETSRSFHTRMGRRVVVIGLIVGLVSAAILPPSLNSPLALVLRSITALLTLVYLLWSLQHLLSRDSLPVLLSLSVTVLFLCGVGFWWLEPTVTSLSDGLWLAFTTAATVGYGDLVPTTPSAKIFSVFVVLLGYGVLSLVTAAIASTWVESSERQLERQMMRELHREVMALRAELAQSRATAAAATIKLPIVPGSADLPGSANPPSVPASRVDRSCAEPHLR